MDTGSLPDPLRAYLTSTSRAGTPPDGVDARSGRAENPACGDVYVLHLWPAGEALAARFEARGCSAVLALGAWLAEHADGSTRSELAALDLAAEVERLGGLSRPRRHAVSVCERALRAALG